MAMRIESHHPESRLLALQVTREKNKKRSSRIARHVFVMFLATLLSFPGFAGPIHDAAIGGDGDQVRQLVASGTAVDEIDLMDRTPLHWAAQQANYELVQLLIELGADLDAKDFENQTPIAYAVWDVHEDIVALLISAGADVNVVNANGERVLDDAVRRGHFAVADMLLAAGAICGTNHFYSMVCNREIGTSE